MIKTDWRYEICKGSYSMYPIEYPVYQDMSMVVSFIERKLGFSIDSKKAYQYPYFEDAIREVLRRDLRRPCVITYELVGNVEFKDQNKPLKNKSLFDKFFSLDISDKKQRLKLGDNEFINDAIICEKNPLILRISRLYTTHEEARTII